MPEMNRRRFTAGLALLGAGAALPKASHTLAQDATPEASPVAPPVAPPSVPVADALTNPRGFIWDADGVLHVALAGSGGTTPPTEEAPVHAILGVPAGGLTGAVVTINNRCAQAIATGLPSSASPGGDVLGAEDLALLGGKLYVCCDGGGPSKGNPDHPSGVYVVNGDGTASLVADLSAFLRTNAPAILPPDWDPDADGYRMVADEELGVFWVLEPNAGGVLHVTPEGDITRIIDLSGEHPVPAAIALAPEGGVYVGYLTAVPYPEGAAKIVHLSAEGMLKDVWTGLTMVTGVAVGPDGTLFALEMSTNNPTEPPFINPGSGKVVKQTGPDTKETVVEGLMFPIAMGIGPDGGIHVALPAIGSSDGSGAIIKVANADGSELDLNVPQTKQMCAPIPETLQA